MPVPNYSVLKGDPISGKLVSGKSPHYQIQVTTDDGQATVAVNVQSLDKSQVLYLVDHAFNPDNAADLLALPIGFTPLKSKSGGMALDYVRSKENGKPMVTRDVLSLLPLSLKAGGRHNDLHNEVVDLLNRAVADKDGTIYAFGSSFSDPGGIQGIHDIHMNQGNPPRNHSGDNGVWQDGALLMNLPATKTWIAVFIAFQTQKWTTDNKTGNVK